MQGYNCSFQWESCIYDDSKSIELEIVCHLMLHRNCIKFDFVDSNYWWLGPPKSLVPTGFEIFPSGLLSNSLGNATFGSGKKSC